MQSATSQAPGVRIAPRRLGHGNIFVGDLARATRFYREVCGIQHVFSEPGIMAEFHSNGNSHHDVGLMQAAKVERRGRDGHLQVTMERGQAPGLNHLGFEMESEAVLVEAWQRAQKLGVRVMRMTDHGMSHSIYAFDPEGNYLEFYADMVDDWRQFYRENEGKLVSGEWNPAANPADATTRYTTAFRPAAVPGAAIHPRRMSRATFAVSNLPLMIEYYAEFAGLRPIAGGADAGYAVFSGTAGEPTLALFPRGQEKQGLHHFGLELPDEKAVADATAALKRSGVPILLEVSHAAKKSVVIADPDGLKLEFYASRAGALPAPSELDEATRMYLI